MTDLLRRFRGLGVALVVLAISAGAAFAAAPRFTPASDTTVETTETTTETTTESTTTTTVGDEDGEDEGDGTTTTTETSDGADVPGAHGELVSTAAQMPTPDGFRNHGAFVSCVAKMGKDVLASTIVWDDVTPESCGIAPDATSTEKTKGKSEQAKTKAQHGNGKAKGHGKPQG